MRVKFNKFERVAGLFVIIAVVGVVMTGIVTAVKQGWFERKVYYQTVFESADGVHAGTPVMMAGLKAGAVEDVDLDGTNHITVHFYVLGKFQSRVREDSKASLTRPFVIGERVVDVSVGTETSQMLAENMTVSSEENTDLMTVMSGKKLGNYFGQMSETLQNLSTVLQAFLNKDRTASMIRMFDKLDPLLTNMNTMSVEVTKLSQQANHDQNLGKVLANTAVLTEDVKALSHTMKDLGPEMPQAAHRAIEALNELTVLVKALEKNYFLRDRVKEVREEEKQRLPAAATPEGK